MVVSIGETVELVLEKYKLDQFIYIYTVWLSMGVNVSPSKGSLHQRPTDESIKKVKLKSSVLTVMCFGTSATRD